MLHVLCPILAYWLMLSVLNTTLNKDYSILFYIESITLISIERPIVEISRFYDLTICAINPILIKKIILKYIETCPSE